MPYNHPHSVMGKGYHRNKKITGCGPTKNKVKCKLCVGDVDKTKCVQTETELCVTSRIHCKFKKTNTSELNKHSILTAI